MDSFKKSFSDSFRIIWRTVARIPKGKVATYGDVAEASQLPGAARLVGYALHGLPRGLDIPWHRVINAQGRISLPPRSASYTRQRELLLGEGIVFNNGKVDLKRFGWRIERRTRSKKSVVGAHVRKINAVNRNRCSWCGADPLYVEYHDREWGIPIHDDQKLFEMLILEGAQAGLSWITILRKREHYRIAFDNFDPTKVARYNKRTITFLMKNDGIVRNKLKIESAVTNAKAFLVVQKEFGSFDRYIWNFVGGKPKKNSPKSINDIPSRTPESDAMSKDLLKRGFKFVGSTICYAFMQATGMVIDHTTDCWRYGQESSF